MTSPQWYDLGDVEALARNRVTEVTVGSTRLAVSVIDGQLGVISGTCNHLGGPLGQGTLEGDYPVCPWHQWRFHRLTGEGEPGYEKDAVPRYATRIDNGRAYVDLASATPRTHLPHPPHPLARTPQRVPGPVRVVGISTTVVNQQYPRESTWQLLLETTLAEARDALRAETQLIKLDTLNFRHCEGYYSKSARACTWPCSITQMDPKDQMDRVYEAIVHWGDVILVSTPIRWGAPSSLYFKMIERCNCIQNQETIASRVLLRNKVAGFTVTGGQDNVRIVHDSAALHEGARALARRSVDMAKLFVGGELYGLELVKGGRKASAGQP